jgi:hypothetical protein
VTRRKQRSTSLFLYGTEIASTSRSSVMVDVIRLPAGKKYLYQLLLAGSTDTVTETVELV